MRKSLIVPVMIASGLTVAGCSLIGLGIGASIDKNNKSASLPGWEIESVRPGRRVTLALKDGRLLSGTYRGLEGGTGQGAANPDAVIHLDGTPPKRVPVADVIQVKVHGSNAKLMGFLVGAIVDTIILVAALDEPPPPPPCGGVEPCYTSCPFVYSFDGERYVLDSEVFGGAIFEAAQRADRASLDHLAEVDGTYRLRLTNELQEVQHVDAVKLLVVDHPAGTRVVPSLDGRLHVLGDPMAPTRATDLRGANVRALFTGGGAWTSNPLRAETDAPDDARDGVVFEFPRPPGAPSVTLAFRARSTAWASFLLRDMLSLHGRDQEAWTDEMNTDAAARGAFLGALRREGLLAVRVWTGSGWRDAGFLANMAEALEREQAVVVDLAGIPGDVLRVRVDSTAGMWILRGAEADFGRPSSPRITEVLPRSARTSRGADVLGLLAAADGRRYTMNPGADSADLVFTAAPRTPDTQRSFVIEAAGYYTILVPAEGEPQEALYDELVGEPGAFGRRAAALLRDGARRVTAAAAYTP